jgi:hypothetical protein
VLFTSPGEAASSQVRWAGLGISWLVLTMASSARPPKFVSKPPDPLLRVEHRVVVAVGRLQLDGEAVGHDLLAGMPEVDAGAGTQDHAGQVEPDDVVRQVVPLGLAGEPAVALEEPERRDRLEDRGPDGVVVDRAGHDGDERLARRELGTGTSSTCSDLRGSLSRLASPRTGPPRRGGR